MCSHTLLRFRKRNPICFALLITLVITLLIIIIASIVHGILDIGTSFENESDIKKTKKENDKDKVEDVNIEFHIKKHKAELEHKKEMDAADKVPVDIQKFSKLAHLACTNIIIQTPKGYINQIDGLGMTYIVHHN